MISIFKKIFDRNIQSQKLLLESTLEQVLDVKDDVITSYFIKKRDHFFKLLSTKTYESSKFETINIIKKARLHILLDSKNVINKEIEINSVIKNQNAINNILTLKAKELDKEELKIRYSQIPAKKNAQSIIYNLYAIKKSIIYSYNDLAPDKLKYKTISSDCFSLYSFSAMLLPKSYFICCFLQDSEIFTIACDNEQIIFSRSTNIYYSNLQELDITVISEISRTTAHILQTYRNFKFEYMVLYGELAKNRELAEQISSVSKLKVITPNPSFFVPKNLIDLFINKTYLFGVSNFNQKYNFLPTFIKGLQQYTKISKWLMIGLMVIALYLSAVTMINIKSVINEENILNTNKQIFNIKKTNINLYDTKELKYLEHFLSLQNIMLSRNIIEKLYLFTPLFNIVKPHHIEFDFVDPQEVGKLEFEQTFDDLKSLINIEKVFKQTLQEIQNQHNSLTFTINSDYKKLEFKAKVNIIFSNTVSKRRNR
ncbi:hypothetical protein [Arcobacter sp. FWKO B]|uniref:hypothetical protein n=1 Tax=Arcobacter sp. FWKO B TaxID=2593672 RepID=UPI0018A52D93|nr:hypothetical protein [Arcobacter sp. FWKO B]QOG11621.1 hypothetical protein FWKOB_02415 [Arcobacter sp. FWKO B]